MSTILKNRNVKTKKRHQCFSCLRDFPLGTQMQYCVGVDEGDFYTIYICKTCSEIFKLSGDYEWETGYVDEQLEHSQTPEELLTCLKRYKK